MKCSPPQTMPFARKHRRGKRNSVAGTRKALGLKRGKRYNNEKTKSRVIPFRKPHLFPPALHVKATTSAQTFQQTAGPGAAYIQLVASIHPFDLSHYAYWGDTTNQAPTGGDPEETKVIHGLDQLAGLQKTYNKCKVWSATVSVTIEPKNTWDMEAEGGVVFVMYIPNGGGFAYPPDFASGNLNWHDQVNHTHETHLYQFMKFDREAFDSGKKPLKAKKMTLTAFGPVVLNKSIKQYQDDTSYEGLVRTTASAAEASWIDAPTGKNNMPFFRLACFSVNGASLSDLAYEARWDVSVDIMFYDRNDPLHVGA